jgi:hypothetical protein
MNRYEKRIYGTLQVIKILFMGVAVANLLVSVLHPFSFGFTLFLQWVIVGVHFYAMLRGISFMSQTVPIFIWGLARSIEITIYSIFNSVNWFMMVGLLVLDLVYIGYLLVHKSSYEFETEPIGGLEEDVNESSY